MDFGTLVGQLGFPIALATFLVWRDYKEKERIIRSLDASTKAIQRSNELEEKLLNAIEESKDGKYA